MWLRPNGEAIWHVGLPPDIAIENEPGVPFALPYFFDDNEVTDTQFAELEDDQLLTAYEEVMNQIGDAGN
jgi:C-terminal processing protease CtpA/Prc